MKITLFLLLSSLSFFHAEKFVDVEIAARIGMESDLDFVPLAATISVYYNSNLIMEVVADSTGKVPSFNLPSGKQFIIQISKNNYVTKMAYLNTNVNDLDNAPNPLYLPFQTTLFKSIEGVDYSLLKEYPMIEFYFDSEYYFSYDKAYATKMQEKVKEIRNK